MKGLLDRRLSVERESSIDLSRDTTRNDLQDFGAKLNEKIIQSSINLFVNVATMLLAIFNSLVNQSGIFGFLASGKDKGRVGGGILWLVLVDCSKVTGITDNRLYRWVLVT